MIAVSSSSRNFAALGKYLVVGRDNVEEGRVAWTSARNLPTDDPELAAKIMRATASQNVRVSQPVYHLALSFDPHDAVNRAAMERVADRVLQELKLHEHQAIIVAHCDRAHPHMHILVNRVHPETGRVWDRWQDQPAIQRVLREQEKELGLRPVEASLDTSREHTGKSFSSLRLDFESHERVSELAQQRYATERDVAAAEARVNQVGVAFERANRASAAFESALGKAFQDSDAARAAFLRAAEEFGERHAARNMRETPEMFGPLLVTNERRGLVSRSVATDQPARTAAREAAGYGAELVIARRDATRVIGAEPDNTIKVAVGGTAEVTNAREHASTALDAARERLHSLRSAEKTMPTREQIEFRLAQGLRRLSPPEFEQLRLSLSTQRFTLACRLRQIARDVALGRDNEQ